MEEDIKILEEFIKYFEAEAISRKYRRNISITVGEDDIEAIENLIKGYRELEEENKKLVEANDNLKATKRIKTYRGKEKIEELEETRKEIAEKNNYTLLKDNPDTPIYDLYGYFLVTLQELMEDK